LLILKSFLFIINSYLLILSHLYFYFEVH